MTAHTPSTDEQIIASLRNLTPGFGTEEEAADRIEGLAATLAAVTTDRDDARRELAEQKRINASNLQVMTEQLELARQTIADAPHDGLCNHPEAPCRCWKARQPKLSTPAEPNAEDLWEIATTTGPRKAWLDADEPPEGDGWELDPNRGLEGESWERFDYHEERYWRRRKAGL